MKVAEYITVSGVDSKTLDEGVNARLKDGYELYGGPYAAQVLEMGEMIYTRCQAMVKAATKPVADRPGFSAASGGSNG